MARKPTRFWHPIKRLVLKAQDNTRVFLTKRESTATLDDVRPRLQHYLRAMYGEGLAVESLAPPKKPNVAVRLLQKVALVKQNGASESSAQCIRLPESIPTLDSGATPLEQYRVMAVQHAERLRRATATHARSVSSNLERDLYQLAESLTIDTQIAESQPGLCAALKAARAESMTRRPKPRWRTDIELRVEEMFQRAWPSFTVAANSATQTGATLHADLPPVPHNNDAESNATWARRTAVTLESMYGRKAAQTYRRVPEITLWHTSVRTELPENQLSAIETETQQRKSDSPTPEWDAPNRSIIPGGASSRGGDKSPGNTPDQSDNGKPSSHKDSGGAADGGVDAEPSRDKGPPKTNRNSASKSNMLRPAKRAQEQRKRSPQHDDHTEATQTTSLDGVGDQSGVDHSEHAVDDAQLAEGITFRYPEWDFNAHTFTESGTVVRVVPPPLGPSDWATLALQEHARETHLAKRQFERLRSHRLRLRRQVQGDELDLEACVEAMVDRCMRVPPSDRLYSQARPGRRDLAITLLIDVSGSTGEMVTGEQRVIDLERIAALVATAAFDALGDDYSILAFSSAGATNVRVHTLKEFGEKNSSFVLQRISALAPHGTTRLGSAVRHATAMLSNHPAPHRLLLILSDGKPHDYDFYFVDYAVQDSRQAVMSARLQGIHPFCITVDATDGETYLPEIFGTAGYRVVNKPSQLSQALLQAVQRMIGSNS